MTRRNAASKWETAPASTIGSFPARVPHVMRPPKGVVEHVATGMVVTAKGIVMIQQLPPAGCALMPGPWWHYTVTTRSGRNQLTGVRAGKKGDVLEYLKHMLTKLEHRENPFGKRWANDVHVRNTDLIEEHKRVGT